MNAPIPRDRFAPRTEPAKPFAAPLITRAASRGVAGRLRDTLLTALLWCGWCYLLVAAAGVFWIPPFVHRLLPVAAPESPLDTLVTVVVCVGLALAGTLVVTGRALRDRARFAGADRRQAAAEPTDAELAATLGGAGLDAGALRNARRVVLHHAADGTLQRVEIP
jgi:poly-beta-1,6-N-acetyl-D-glucosamine biosynthesis protein PgaD